MIGNIQVTSWTRKSLSKDDPARQEFEDKCNVMFKIEDGWGEESAKAHLAYQNAKPYTKKKEGLEKKYEKLKTQHAKLAEELGHIELRKQWRLMHLEDLAEYSDCPGVRTVALAELGHITFTLMRKDLKTYLEQEAYDQGVRVEEDITFIAGSVMNSLISFPSHMNGKTLVRIEKERVQKNRIISDTHKLFADLPFAPRHSGTGLMSLGDLTTMLEELRGQTVQEVIDGCPKVVEKADEQSKLWLEHLETQVRKTKKKKDDYFASFSDIITEYGQGLIPRVVRETGLRKILKEETDAGRYDLIRTAIETGWATNCKWLMLLPEKERIEIQHSRIGIGTVVEEAKRILSKDQIERVIPTTSSVERLTAVCYKIRPWGEGGTKTVMLYESPSGAALTVPAGEAIMIESRWPNSENVTAHIWWNEKGNGAQNSKLVYIQNTGGERRVVGLVMAYDQSFNRGPNE